VEGDRDQRVSGLEDGQQEPGGGREEGDLEAGEEPTEALGGPGG
jgi:hypothetical protein